MGKLTEYIQTKQEKQKEMNEHNIFTNKDMQDLFFNQVEDLDFFKYKLEDCEGGVYYFIRLRLDKSPLKIKNPQENPYEYKLHSNGSIFYNNIEYDIEKQTKTFSDEQNKTLRNLKEYLKDYFTQDTGPLIGEAEYQLNKETGKFEVVKSSGVATNIGAIRTGD